MKNSKKHLVLSFLLILLFLFAVSCSRIALGGGGSPEEFDAFLDQIFTSEVQKDTLSLNFSISNPENYNITDPETTFGHYSVDYIKGQLATNENYLETLKKFDYDSLSESQKLSYDILNEDLTLQMTAGDFILYNECLGPTTGTQAQLPVLLAEYYFDDKSDIETYLELLPKVYDYFKEITEFEREKSAAGLFMNDDVADSIIDQCKLFIKDKDNNFLIKIFNDRIADFDGLTKAEKKSYQAANKDAVINSVIPAYELLISTLTELKGTGKNKGGLCNYKKGKEYYEYLIASNTGSSRSIEELKDMLDSRITTNLLKLSTLMTEDPDLYEKAVDIKYPLTDPAKIISYLKKAIKEDFPSCPQVDCSIKYVPESLQDHLSPAMYLIPTIDNYKDNTIYINDCPDNDLSAIFTTIAHEGYPGHLYQSIYFRDKKPAALRCLLDFGGYVEGWATYVEYYSYHLAGFKKNVAEFLEANMIANMALYCRLDMGIHYDGWTPAETAAYLKNYGITDGDTVKLLYNTMIEEPALYPEYGIGYLEIADLKDKAQKALGDNFELKEFHTFLLDIGPAQFDIISDRMDTWIQEQKSKND